MSPCWCQGFQNYLQSSGMWLSSGFDLPLCDAPWLIWSVVWACLGIRDHDEEMVLGGVGGRWMLHEVTLFSLWLSITHCHLLSESNHLQHKVRMLWKKKVQLPAEHIALEECSKESKRLCKEGSLKIHDMYQAEAGRMDEESGAGCPCV